MIEIPHCPKLLVTSDVAELLEAVDLLEHGLPPIGGGSLDQTMSFCDGLRMVKRLDQQWKHALQARAANVS